MPTISILVMGDQVYAKPLILSLENAGLGYSVVPIRTRVKVAKSVVDKVDVAVFTGGEDVYPSVYGHRKYFTTSSDELRDRVEIEAFELLSSAEKPMIGICRGSQFLWTALEGTLIQDLDNHTKNHHVLDLATGEKYQVNSTHHQAALPLSLPEGVQVLAVADPKVSTQQIFYDESIGDFFTAKDGVDIEAWATIDGENILGIQWHPEFPNAPRSSVTLAVKLITKHIVSSLL